MSRTINFRIKIKISIFLNFFIGPPPPIREEISLTTRQWLFYVFIIAQSIRTVYINLLSSEQQTKQHLSLQMMPQQSHFAWGTQLGVVAL